LPTAIGVMVIALALSLGVIELDLLGLDHGLRQIEATFVSRIDFSDVLVQGMLSLLLFAGALQIDLTALKRFRWQVASLALLGTVASTVLIGFALYFVLQPLGLPLPLLYCLLFGALISPTDPIAVLGILQSAKAPKEMELVITVTLAARALTVGLPVAVAGGRFGLPRGSPAVLTWGGLRGGISVALALSIPAGEARDTVLTLTYCVVVFSILVQGLTIGKVVRKAAC